jgi:rhodanese-related sulfurtransferase
MVGRMASLRNLFKEVMTLFAISIVIAFAVNYFSPKGIALTGQWDSAAGVVTAKSKEFDGFFIPIPDAVAAKEIFDSGHALFVDARSRDIYEEGHIRGAASLPVGQFSEAIEPFKTTYPTSTPIVTYCSVQECNDSHKLAQLLFMEGYTDISIFIDGYPGWKAEGYPSE